mmetsp:Transcript_30386/g.49106  ORF Transcript_30386/g.49106 Transcript_30386/m.49106 type:complete len:235 (+) Transcript_30386:67-771(+)
MNSNLIKLFVLLATVAVCQASMAEYLKNLEFVPLKGGKAPTPPIFPNQMSSAFSITYFLPGSTAGIYGYSTTDLTVNKQRFDAGFEQGVMSAISVYTGAEYGTNMYTLVGSAGSLSCTTTFLPLPLPKADMLQNSTFIGAVNLPRHGLCYGWRLFYANIIDITFFTRATGTQVWAPALVVTNLYAVEYSATKSVPVDPSTFNIYSTCPAPSGFHLPRSIEETDPRRLLANTFIL